MNIGLWNIDHPECDSSRPRRHKRFEDIKNHLQQQDCDVLVLTESNAALQLDGYSSVFSHESPFLNKNRNYKKPNCYHQIGIYSKIPFELVHISEAINGVLLRTSWQGQKIAIYGNAMTIKDQWQRDTKTTYSNRVEEQIKIISQITKERFIVAGDFNLKLGWVAKKGAYRRIQHFVEEKCLTWPTEKQQDTVQHVIHSTDLNTHIFLDTSVQHSKGKKDSLSDHPFILINVLSK